MDVIRHLPRSIFSDKQYNIIAWTLEIMGVNHVPSIQAMKKIEVALQESCGIKTIRYDGPLGHIYYVNSLADILGQEMANPRVRPHLNFYPELSRTNFGDARQFGRWMNELDPDLTTPMFRSGNQDFYLFEPSCLKDGTYCMPIRWFEREKSMWAKAWRIVPESVAGGWTVHEFDNLVVPAESFAVNFPRLSETADIRGIPSPTNILGSMRTPNDGLHPWTHTNPSKGNRWRSLAKKHCVLAMPMWFYCDDTSGNTSKKWNKHNSFLFTLAGLPHNEIHFEHHVHFLSTSNLAPPLEMLDGIADQIEQAHGIWAWDCQEKDMVLLIPSVLAMLGDNPMQSEFACHVRCCFVKGQDGLSPTKEANILVSDHDGSDASTTPSQDAAHKGKTETPTEMIDRVKRFMKVIGEHRTRKDTLAKLSTIFTTSSQVGKKTEATQLKTKHGIKDVYQDHFTDLIFDLVKGLRGRKQDKQDKIDHLLRTLPDNITSPVWRIRDLDPHSDTPVEILHVILLGFVKYFWRDAIARLNAEERETLIIRLCSFSVEGLGVPALAGRTLVKYAGSLTGRDFRVIAQASPFVLYDLVPKECFAAWLALSSLIPLIWQPVIQNIDDHVHLITERIEHLLECTARWTPRWFNKPKFHIILHLPAHIRRFGPAILFATETFESFNALIRSLSVHSNRQAPSRDIARGFANQSRIQHILSGGWFLQQDVFNTSDDTVDKSAVLLCAALTTADRHHFRQMFTR
ncbi:hypothetical protein C8J56DRAFT_859767 [Mycena floridula]|nr:hypothetical protein C8J56DRAFT_859767 [Mycena floridula]